MRHRRELLKAMAAAFTWAALPVRAQTSDTEVEDREAHVVRLAEPLETGDIHIVPEHFALYWTLAPQRAIRYPVAIGKEERYVSGVFEVARKVEWPSWKPTPEMIAREPEKYLKYADGMPGGPDNPLGARALYLSFEDGVDSMLRIHGTNDEESIGHPVSNGCIRLRNDHIIDLYDRVPLGTRAILHPKPV